MMHEQYQVKYLKTKNKILLSLWYVVLSQRRMGHANYLEEV